VREVICVFGHETVEKLFQVASRGWIGIFHDDDAGAGVLNKKCDCSVSHSAVVDFRLHVFGDFVESFAVRAHFELVVMHMHSGSRYFSVTIRAKQAAPLRRTLISVPANGLLGLMQSDIERVLFDGTAIHKRLDEIAAQITVDYSDRELTVIAILTGSLMFMSDLLRRIPLPLKLDCLSVVSYHGKTQPSGEVIFKQLAVPDLADRDVLILDDILDTGQTLAAVREKLDMAKPRSIRICVLLSKRKRRARDVDADYIGFEIDDDFVVGYGLDFMERYRNLPYVGVLRKDLLEQPNQ
jgi:hypoxanthine phosphoribosyltransferase